MGHSKGIFMGDTKKCIAFITGLPTEYCINYIKELGAEKQHFCVK